MFNELVKEKKIEDKNILKIIETGNGIILFPKYIISLTCKYTNRKQINLFKFSLFIDKAFHNPLFKKKIKTALEIQGNGSNWRIISFCPFDFPLDECPPCAKLRSSKQAECK